MKNMKATLHYLHDPLCGWCYAAEKLVDAAIDIEGIELEMHGGGLWPERKIMPQEFRQFVKEADQRVGKMTGQPYGDAYLNGLLQDPELTLESHSTTAAVLAAKVLDPSRELAMMQAIQHAHYEQGLHVVRPEVLLDIAVECGFEPEVFTAEMEAAPVDDHIRETQKIMARYGARGFPFFILEMNGKTQVVDHQGLYSDPEGFAESIQKKIQDEAG